MATARPQPDQHPSRCPGRPLQLPVAASNSTPAASRAAQLLPPATPRSPPQPLPRCILSELSPISLIIGHFRRNLAELVTLLTVLRGSCVVGRAVARAMATARPQPDQHPSRCPGRPLQLPVAASNSTPAASRAAQLLPPATPRSPPQPLPRCILSELSPISLIIGHFRRNLAELVTLLTVLRGSCGRGRVARGSCGTGRGVAAPAQNSRSSPDSSPRISS